MIKYENDKAFVDNLKFTKDKKTGYYLSTTKIGEKRKRLHIYIWEKYNGKIPNGYDIHHIDKNKDNNDINNLELLTPEQHQKKHAFRTEEQKEILRKNIEIIRPLASAWHKSKEGRIWHSIHSKKQIDNMEEKEYKCQYCGKLFYKKPLGQNKFCCNNCKSAYRRMIGIDNITRICKICGKPFETNKYGKKFRCNECSRKSYKIN